jgi:DNA-binding NtrC family response regulator
MHSIYQLSGMELPKGAWCLMKKAIVVVDADQDQCRRLCNLLEKDQYSTVSTHSIQYLEDNLKHSNFLAVILDIDTVPVDNRTVRELTLQFPEVYFFCLSEQSFHPELKEAICYHIYACLNKPVDPDELFYFLRSIYENETDSNNQIAE